jgi:hypothetical protein
MDPKTIIVPYGAVNWQSKEQTEFTWRHGTETVKGSVRELWGEVEKSSDPISKP